MKHKKLFTACHLATYCLINRAENGLKAPKRSLYLCYIILLYLPSFNRDKRC